MKRALFFLAFIILPSLAGVGGGLYAQSWRWAEKGGSSSNSQASAQYESVEDMATDRNGNIYTISTVTGVGLNVNGVQKQGWGIQDVMINSFRCDGSLRWSKVIGGGQSDYAYKLRADSLDGVYAAIKLNRDYGANPVINIDADATLTGLSNKTFYLLKYDTAGHYKWIISPESDTISFTTSYSKSGPIDMAVEGTGIIHLFCQLPPGVFGGSYVVTSLSDHILKYNANGVLVIAFKPQILLPGSTILHANMSRDPKNGRYYIAGGRDAVVYVGSTTITKPTYITCFDPNGSFLWKRENSYANVGGFVGRPVIDANSDIYVCGTSIAHSSINPADTFNGYIITHGAPSPTVFVVKLNLLGNNIWAADATVKATTSGTELILRNNGELDLISPAGFIKWPGCNDSVVAGYYRPTITRFNTQTGKVLGVDAITGNTSAPTMIVTDGRDNVYVGGDFSSSITAGSTTLNSTGGTNDFFIAKYGYDNCTCTSIPEPKFTTTNTSGTTWAFTYTGTTYSSITWDFGDGNTSNAANPTHTFAAPCFYQVIVTVSQGCGDNTYGMDICMQPKADASSTVNANQSVTYTYTGSPADSVVWDFGDSKKATTYGSDKDTTHAYKTAGSYNICATAYSKCGTNMKCITVQAPESVWELNGQSVKIYPNPVTDRLVIANVQTGTAIVLFGIIGCRVYSGVAEGEQTEISTSALQPGSYLLQLTGTNGVRSMMKILKQ